jgi:hypothetical protein
MHYITNDEANLNIKKNLIKIFSFATKENLVDTREIRFI